MKTLHSSKFDAVAEKLQVDHEDGLTTAQLMVRLHCVLPPCPLGTAYSSNPPHCP